MKLSNAISEIMRKEMKPEIIDAAVKQPELMNP
jgi:hypothetical protein